MTTRAAGDQAQLAQQMQHAQQTQQRQIQLEKTEEQASFHAVRVTRGFKEESKGRARTPPEPLRGERECVFYLTRAWVYGALRGEIQCRNRCC